MRDSRTVLAFVFGLVGGIIILVTLTMFFQLFFFVGFGGPPFYGPLGFVIGIASGSLVIVGAAMTFVRPSGGVAWGIVMVVFGALSAFGLAGFGVGMGLSIAGGALAIVAGSSGPAGPPSVPGMLTTFPVRACTACGMLISVGFAHCPHCGAAVPAPRTMP